MTPQPHYCIIDGSGFMHRARAMAVPRTRAVDGMEVGVTGLFAAMIAKAVARACAGKAPPTHWAVAFDPPRSDSWRRKVCAAYKAHRPEADPLFKAQLPLMKECCRAAGFSVLEAPEHEADDLLAAYASDAHALGARVTLVTSDKDLMQMVRPGVLVWDAQRDLWYTESVVAEKFGVPASRLGDYLALAGDVADGIPGARGIGPKTATAILSAGWTLSDALVRSDEITNPRWRALIETNAEALQLARLLVSLDIANCPRPVPLEGMETETPHLAGDRIRAWRRTALA